LIDTFNAMAKRLGEYQAVQLDKLLDEKKKVDLMAGLMRDGLVMCTLEGKQLYTNKIAREILQNDVLCRDMECTVHGGLKRPELKNLISVARGTVFNYYRNGKNSFFEVVSEVFRPAKQEPVAIIVFRDITVEHEIDEMKNDIFNSVAHDLRAPLLGLQAYIMILREGKPDAAEQKNILATMEESSKTLTSLIENILDISKLESGVMALNKADFDLYDAALHAVETLQPLAGEKGLKISCEIPKGSLVRADRNLVERVFANLISNAVKFTQTGGVKLLCEVKDGFYTLTVRDSGVGIKESELDKVFEKYYQSSSERKGYGLGLAIVKRIIEAHGGTIFARSVYGDGTDMVFTLPKGELK